MYFEGEKKNAGGYALQQASKAEQSQLTVSFKAPENLHEELKARLKSDFKDTQPVEGALVGRFDVVIDLA